MNSAKRRNSVVVLFCSDALAVAIGDEPADQQLSRLMKEHHGGLVNGSVIAVMATSGDNFLWPCRGAT